VEEWKYGGCCFFLNNVKIGNNDFITFWGYVNLNDMTHTTNYCSKPTDNVSGGSIAHIESPWTLNITPILLISSGYLIFGFKNRFITILNVFDSESLHEVLYLGLEFIGLWLMCTKYIIFLTRHTQYVWSSYPTIRWVLRTLLSWTHSTRILLPWFKFNRISMHDTSIRILLSRWIHDTN